MTGFGWASCRSKTVNSRACAATCFPHEAVCKRPLKSLQLSPTMTTGFVPSSAWGFLVPLCVNRLLSSIRTPAK